MDFTLPKISEQHPVVGVTSRLFKFFEFTFRAVKRKREPYGIVNYMERSIAKGDVVINVGSGEDDYLYIMRRKVGKSGKIIVFESKPELFQQLSHLKKIFKWLNIELEPLVLSDFPATKVAYKSLYKRSSHGAAVININGKREESAVYTIVEETLDNYCWTKNIHPSFLKIDTSGNELRLLKGAINILRLDRPKILLKCEERLAGAQSIFETFKYLLQLGYTGYFILDTIKIPVENFDFNLYQNRRNNFYCNNFMFE
ncbi:MAG TPA: FkbM family methyltransferase [Ginsengibacter sp.]